MSHIKRDSRVKSRQPADISHELRKWALEEMGFRPQGRHVNEPAPTPEDFKLMSRGAMVDVWEFVVKHVKSTKNAQKVKGNLKIHQLLQSNRMDKTKLNQPGEKEKLLSQYTEINKELSDAKERVNNVLKEIKYLEKEILTSEQEFESASKKVSDLQKRNALLSAHSKHCDNIIHAYQDLTMQLRNKLDNLKTDRQSIGETTYYSVHRDNTVVLGTPSRTGDQNGAPALESSCTRSVRETCELISSYLKSLCDQSDVEPNNESDNGSHLSKDQLWSYIEGILNKHSSQNILSSLVSTTQDSTTSLKELTITIDLKRDAEQLKFLYQKGKLTDTSQTPSLLQSVHQLIEEGQSQHFKSFLDAERASNEAWKLHKELQSLNKEMENRMESRYRGLPGSVDLSRILHHSELELTASKASLVYLKSAIKDLDNSRREKLLALETIQSKYNKIKDFETLAQTKQSVIQALVKQNFAARTNLEKQRNELLHYIQSKVCPHEAHIVALATGLRQAVSRDIDKFAVLPITRLQHVNMPSGERIAADDLSIYRLEGLHNRPGGAVIGQALDRLEFPFYKAPEELLPRIVEIKDTLDDTSTLVKKRQQDIQEMEDENATEKIVAHLNTLQHEVNQQDAFEMNQIVPRVQEGLNKAAKALTQCIAVKDSASAWWEQPAQFVVPWVKVDDMNTRQWLDQWTLHSTRLRQLQMHH